MSVDIHRTFVNDGSFIRGAARILIAPIAQAFPTKIGDVIELGDLAGMPVTPPTYDALDDWLDLGATKTGIQITINNSEETFDIDQSFGDIDSQPTGWECSVGTQLAEFTPERMQVAWEGSAITIDNTAALVAASGPEKEIGFGTPTSYTRRRLSVVYQRPPTRLANGTLEAGKIRLYTFRRVQRMPQESSITHQKGGEQISIPVRFRAIPDTSISDVAKRFFIIRDQWTT